MTTNPQTPIRPIYKLWEGLKKDKLYTKSFPEFEKQFSVPEARRKLYDGLFFDGLYTKPPEEFEKQFFSDLKKKEPTGQSSTSTLQTGGESTLPNQGNTAALSPEQQEAFRNLPPVATGDPDFEKQRFESDQTRAKDARVRDIALGIERPNPESNILTTTGKSIWNVLRYQLPSGIVAGVAALNQNLPKGSGAEVTYGSGFVKEDDRKKANFEALKWADKQQKQGAEFTKDLVSSLDKVEDPLDFINWVGYATGQAAGQIPVAIGTFGVSSIGQEVGSIYLEGVKKIAEEKGLVNPITGEPLIEAVINQELDDPAAAVAWGTAAGALDYVGAKGVMSFGKSQFKKALRDRVLVAKAAGTEGGTEYTQTFMEQIGSNRVAGNDLSKAWDNALRTGGTERLEALAQGAVGGGGAVAVTSAIPNKKGKNVQATEQGQKAEENALVEDTRARHAPVEKESDSKITPEEDIPVESSPEQAEIVEESQDNVIKDKDAEITEPINAESAGNVGVGMDNFTESKDLNRIFSASKKKYGEKNGAKYNHAADRLVNPNENTIIEVRSNGVVVKRGDNFLLLPFTNTDANYKKWELSTRPIDVTDQFTNDPSSQNVNKDDDVNISQFANQETSQPSDTQTGESVTQEQQTPSSDVQETIQTETKDNTLSQSEDVEFDWLGTEKKGKIISEENGKYKIKGTDGTIYRVPKSEVTHGQAKQPTSKSKAKKSNTVKAEPKKSDDSGVNKEVGQTFITSKKEKVSGKRLTDALNKVADKKADLARRIREEDEYAKHVSEKEKDEALAKSLEYAEKIRRGEVSHNLSVAQDINTELTGEEVPILPKPSKSATSESLSSDLDNVGFVQPSGLNFSMPFDISAVTDGAKRWVKKYFTSAGLLPQSAFGIANKSEQSKTATLKKAKFLVSDLEKAVKKDFKAPDYPLINQVLKGEKPYSDLPPATAKATEALRNHVTQIQDELINSGVVQGDLAIAIDESKGTYLTRSYKVHDDPKGYSKWLDENPEGQRIKNRAIGFIRSKFPNATKEEVDGLINELLFKPDAPVAILKGGKLGSKDLGVLTKRKDIAPEIRALLGEYDNPIVNYSKSVLKMSNLIANHKLQAEMRKDGMGKYFFEKPTGKYFVKIAPSGSTTMDALTEGKDLYTSEDVAEAINEWNQKDLTPELLSWLYKLNGLASYSKTVLSTSTHARNLVGSGIIAIANGHVFDGAGKFNEAVKSTVTSLANGTDAKVREKLLDYAKLGIIGDSHQAGYLKDLIKDINKNATDPSMLLNNRYRKFVNKSLESINAAYQAEDDLFKIFAFENEVSRYSKAYAEDLKSGKMTENDIRLKAAEIVRATFPTYSLSPKGIKALRKLPFISSFPTFPAEMIRTTWNNAALTKKELADPKTRSIGVKRLAGMMTAMGMTYAMTEFMKQAYGIFDDEDDALDKFVAPWAKNGHRVHLRGKENGTYRYVDLSYSDPYSMFKRPVETLLSDGDLLDNAKESARMVMEPFISEGMLTKRGREIASNVDENKRTIYNPEAPIGDQLKDIYAHLASSVEPGTVRSLKRISGVLKGESGNDYGKEFSIADELIFMGLGQRIETLDPPQALYFKTREIGKRLTDAKDIFDNVKYKYSRGKATEEELKKALKTSEEVSNKIKSELLEVIDAATRLGIDQRVIIDNVKKNIGKKDTF